MSALPIDLQSIIHESGVCWNRGDVIGALRQVHMYFSLTVNDHSTHYRAIIDEYDLNTRAVHMLKRCIDYIAVTRGAL